MIRTSTLPARFIALCFVASGLLHTYIVAQESPRYGTTEIIARFGR